MFFADAYFKIPRVLGKKEFRVEEKRTDGAAEAARVAHNTRPQNPPSGATLVFQRRPGRGLFAIDRSLNRVWRWMPVRGETDETRGEKRQRRSSEGFFRIALVCKRARWCSRVRGRAVCVCLCVRFVCKGGALFPGWRTATFERGTLIDYKFSTLSLSLHLLLFLCLCLYLSFFLARH